MPNAINQTQKELLLKFLKEHPELQTGRFSPECTFRRTQNLWEEISEILNSVPNGAEKNWRRWRKVSLLSIQSSI